MRSPFLAWSLSLVACIGRTEPTETASSTNIAPSTKEVEPEPEPELAPQPELEPARLVIGWSGAPAEANDEAKRQNSAALELHRAGQYQAALAGFEASITSDPSYAWARYNAACALARLDRHAEAAARLRVLWLEDLPQFRQRALDDPDLAGLFESKEGAALLAELPQIEAVYTDALVRGAPAFVYRPRPGQTDDRDFHIPYRDLRIGVYLPDSRRFVAMVPEVDRAFSGLLDPEGKRAAVAAGFLAMKDMWEVQPERSTVTLYSLERFGEQLIRPRTVTPTNEVLYGFELRFGEGAELIVTLINVGYAPMNEFFRVDQRTMTKIGWTHNDVEEDDPPELPSDEPILSIIDRAIAIYRPNSLVEVRRRTITHADAPGKLTLSRGHHADRRIIASPDPLVLIVASMTERFSDDGASSDDEVSINARDHHVVDRVDFRNQTVMQLSEGKGLAHIAWASDGTLLLETDKATRRYPPGSTDGIEDVPEGVHFGTPPFPEVGGV